MPCTTTPAQEFLAEDEMGGFVKSSWIVGTGHLCPCPLYYHSLVGVPPVPYRTHFAKRVLMPQPRDSGSRDRVGVGDVAGVVA